MHPVFVQLNANYFAFNHCAIGIEIRLIVWIVFGWFFADPGISFRDIPSYMYLNILRLNVNYSCGVKNNHKHKIKIFIWQKRI